MPNPVASQLFRFPTEQIGFCDRAAYFASQQPKTGAVALTYLASQQVEALDPVGAFVNGVDPVVPVVLLDVVFAGVAVPAVELDRQVVGFQTPLRRPAFGDRGQQVEQQCGGVGFVP
jgi:hypothetical protein